MYFFHFFKICIAVSLYGPLQRATVRACYVPSCLVHLSFDCVILLDLKERNGDGDGRSLKRSIVDKSKFIRLLWN